MAQKKGKQKTQRGWAMIAPGGKCIGAYVGPYNSILSGLERRCIITYWEPKKVKHKRKR